MRVDDVAGNICVSLRPGRVDRRQVLGLAAGRLGGVRRHRPFARGAVQVDTRVGSAWFHRLKLKYDKLLSSFAFNFNLRPYTLDRASTPSSLCTLNATSSVVGPSRNCAKCPSTAFYTLVSCVQCHPPYVLSIFCWALLGGARGVPLPRGRAGHILPAASSQCNLNPRFLS